MHHSHREVPNILCFQNLPAILKFTQQFVICACELERTTLNYSRKARKQKYVSELHAAQNKLFPKKLVQSTALHSVTPLKTVMFIAKDESKISKEFTINFGR